MSSAFYPGGLESLWSWSLVRGSRPDVDAVEIQAVVVDTTYNFNAAHNTFEDLGDSPMLAPVALSNTNITGGLLTADNLVYTRPNLLGKTVKAIVILFVWDAGSQLLAYMDEATLTLPQLLTEGNLTLRWNPAGVLRIG